MKLALIQTASGEPDTNPVTTLLHAPVNDVICYNCNLKSLGNQARCDVDGDRGFPYPALICSDA